MKALKCDRCGKFYIHNAESTGLLDGINIARVGIVEDTDFMADHKNYDICSQCAKSFVLWFKEVELDIAKEAMAENELHSVVE